MKRLTSLVFGLVIAAAVLSAGYSAYWYVSAEQIRGGIAGWADDVRGHDTVVEYQDVRVSGFPFWLNVMVDGLRVETGEDADGGYWGWSGSWIGFDIRPWSFSEIKFRLPGTYQVTYPVGIFRPDGKEKAGARSLFAISSKAEGYIGLKDGFQPWAAYVDIGSLEILAEDIGPAGDNLLEAESARISIRTYSPGEPAHLNSTLDVAFSLEGLVLPEDEDLPLGSRFDLIQGEAALMGALGPAPAAAAVQDWRDEGGTLEVLRLNLRWGDLDVEGKGTLALDGEMQPMGALTTSIRGFKPALEALAEKGIIKASQATTAKVILGLLAKRGTDGRKTLSAPLTVQERKLNIGPIHLLDLPPITWK
ncbi:MAG: DUF2125 domain-containing protein [Rhodospirillaceae bacterium]|nr:DUF2125 domain-containing protein [Rhodospirillaceae bacterium]MBT5752773.1 DUF2125 domain-containing protein [Rhodospirillaceae bacterium]